MIKYFLLTTLLTTTAYAAGAAHEGLLSNAEMALVTHNAQATQKLMFPDQNIAACWPYDEGAKQPPLTGTAYCKVETPRMLNNALRPVRGPDLFCSYLQDEPCAMRAADPTR